jgi:hypothetical protein
VNALEGLRSQLNYNLRRALAARHGKSGKLELQWYTGHAVRWQLIAELRAVINAIGGFEHSMKWARKRERERVQAEIDRRLADPKCGLTAQRELGLLRIWLDYEE